MQYIEEKLLFLVSTLIFIFRQVAQNSPFFDLQWKENLVNIPAPNKEQQTATFLKLKKGFSTVAHAVNEPVPTLQ